MKVLLWSAPVICALIACTVQLSEHEGRACDQEHGCAPGLECQGGTCILAELIDDEGPGGADSGAKDAGVDASVQPPVDAGTDAGVDAGTLPGTDAGADAGVDAGVDAGTNPGFDGGYPPNTFFVDPAGDDTQDGRSPATAWKTVAKVSGAPLPAGAWVLFKGGGVWNESLAPTRSGVQGSPIVFGAYGTGRPVLDGTGSLGNSALNANGKSWLTFRGLELRGWHGGYQLVYLANSNDTSFEDLYLHDADKGFHASPSAPSNNITIRGVTVENIRGGTYTHAISTPVGGTGWLVSDSRFSNIEQSCVIDAADGTQYLRNTFHDCGKLTSSSDRHGVYLRGPNVVLRDNELYDTAGSCIFVGYPGAILENNRLHACGSAGIEWSELNTGAGMLIARRNRIWDSVNGISLGTATVLKFYLSNNSILTVRASGLPGSAGVVVKTNTEVALENNLVTGSAATALSVNRVSTAGPFIDRTNVWHTTSAAGTPFNWNGTAMTLAEYRSTSGQATSISADPQLTSATATAPDFRLQGSSPARDFGVTNPASGTLTPGCDGAVDHYCGVAPEAGALERLTP